MASEGKGGLDPDGREVQEWLQAKREFRDAAMRLVVHCASSVSDVAFMVICWAKHTADQRRF